MRVWLVLDELHPVPQHWIEDSRGRLARVDLAFIEQRVAVEYDGSWREGELWALNRDRERLNQVQAHAVSGPGRLLTMWKGGGWVTRSCSVRLVPALSLKLVARRHIDYGRTRSMICMSA